MRVINADELRRLVPMPVAIDRLEAAFRVDDHVTPARRHVAFGDGELLFMPSSSPRAAGVKLVTVTPSNAERGLPLISGTYLMFDRTTLQPTVAIDAAALTAIRTAAVSGVATRALAHRDAETLAIFGAGSQASAHLEAMVAVRPIGWVSVVSRSQERAKALAQKVFSMGLAGGVDDAVNAVSEADIICTCTTSATPVFEGRYLKKDVHVNAVGSYKPDVRELDTETIRRAAVVAVEAREAVGESGDLAIPLAAGDLDEGAVVTLGDLLGSPETHETGITVFKSVGRAFEDLAVAEAAVEALG